MLGFTPLCAAPLNATPDHVTVTIYIQLRGILRSQINLVGALISQLRLTGRINERVL